MAEDEPEDEVAADGEQPEKRGRKSALTKKLIKITTVVVYACGVSSAGFLLSLYYIIFWDPQIKGVRPPDYLRAVEMEDYVGVASRPGAQIGQEPTTLPQTMPTEFTDDLFSNFTAEEIAAATGMREGQPTPNVLPVIKDGYEAAHHTPTQPLSAFRSDSTQGSGMDTSLGHSSHHQPHRTNSRDQQHYEQQQQRHHQQQQQLQHHHQQQQQQQQQALTALA